MYLKKCLQRVTISAVNNPVTSFFLDHNTTGDGLVSALQFLSVLKKTGMKASEAASIVTVMPQVLRNAVVKLENKNSYMEK